MPHSRSKTIFVAVFAIAAIALAIVLLRPAGESTDTLPQSIPDFPRTEAAPTGSDLLSVKTEEPVAEAAHTGTMSIQSSANEGQIEDPEEEPGGETSPSLTADVATHRDVIHQAFDRFIHNPLVKQWKDAGTTDDEIRSAISSLQSQGVPVYQLDDPNLISQYLPQRNIEPAYIDSVHVPESAAAGARIPFSVKANFPDPSFSFEAWEITKVDEVVNIRMVGNKSTDMAPSIIVPIELEGVIEGLKKGEYTIRFVAIGDAIERPLTIN